jgi:hypothetical protein
MCPEELREAWGNRVCPVFMRRFEPELLNMKQDCYPFDSDTKESPFKSSR